MEVIIDYMRLSIFKALGIEAVAHSHYWNE